MSKRTRAWKKLVKNTTVYNKKIGSFAGMRAMLHRREMYYKKYSRIRYRVFGV